MTGDIMPWEFDHEDDYLQAIEEAIWDCAAPNPCGCPDCEDQ